MSNYFKKKVPPRYRYPLAEMDLSAWLEDRVCATIYGPAGVGKAEFLREYFSGERCRELAMQDDAPLLVLWWTGTRLAGMQDSTEVLYHVYRDAYRMAAELELPGLRPALQPPATLQEMTRERLEDLKAAWNGCGAKLVLVVEKFNRFMCVLGEKETGRAAQIDILNLRDLPMIVSNDYVYSAQYCPAIEQVRGSNIFNDLAKNYFVFSAFRPSVEEFDAYLERIFRGEGRPFADEEVDWLWEMTGGFPELTPPMADALYDAKQQGLDGLAAQEACLQACLEPKHPVSLQMQQWVKDLSDREYAALRRLASLGEEGGPIDGAEAPALDWGLYYLDRARDAHLCCGVLREYLRAPASERAPAAPAAPAAEGLLSGLGGGPIHVEKMIVVQGGNNVLEGDRKVQVVAAGNDPGFWQELVQNMHTLALGSGAAAERVGNQLAAIQRPDPESTEEQIEAWASENGENLLAGVNEARMDLDREFAELCARPGEEFVANLPELTQRLPQATALVVKQSVIIDRMFTGTLRRFGMDDLMDFSPCALLYGVLLERRMKEVLVPLYRADSVLGGLRIDVNRPVTWNSLNEWQMSRLTIGNLYGSKTVSDRMRITDRMAQLGAQAGVGSSDPSWWYAQYGLFIRAGDLRNNTAHSTRMPLEDLTALRNLVLGNHKVDAGLLNRLNLCCRMSVALGYQTCSQAAAAAEWQTAEKMQQYDRF